MTEEKRNPRPSGVYSPQETSKLTRKQIDEYQANPNASLLTGIGDLDEIMHPLRSNICVIHGITDHGKSTLADIISENNMPDAESDDIIVKCLFEDSIEEQGIRNASANTDPFLSVSQITSGKMVPGEMQTFDKALVQLAKRPVWHIGNSQKDHRKQTLTTAPMLLEAMNWIVERQQKRIRMIVVDYFQAMAKHRSQFAKTNRDIYIEQVDLLDSIAQGFGCPLILLSQSNRTPDSQGRIPQKSDLQETSRLEQRARTVIAVYRPHMHTPIGQSWDFGGKTMAITDENLVLIGIQKQKYKPAPLYRLFRTNEQRVMTKVDLGL